MGNWPSPKWPSRVNGWAGQQSVTRELFIRDDRGLGSRPIAELDSLASGPSTSLGLKGSAETFSIWELGRLELAVDLGETDASSFTIALLQSKAESVLLTYNTTSRTLTLDTKDAGYGQAGTWEAIIGSSGEDKLTLDIFIDHSILEIFVGDGTVFSAAVWPRYQESQGISLVAREGTVAQETITLTPLGSSWC